MVSLWCWYCQLHAHFLHMTITLRNLRPFTFYLPFHSSPPAGKCPIHVPSTCTLGLDLCAPTHFLGARILTTLTISTPPAALSSLLQHLPSPFTVIALYSVSLSTGPSLGVHLNRSVWRHSAKMFSHTCTWHPFQMTHISYVLLCIICNKMYYIICFVRALSYSVIFPTSNLTSKAIVTI